MATSDTPLLGSAGAIALYALAQVLFASFAFAGPFVMVFAEWRGRRTGDRRYRQLAFDLSRFNLLVFGVAGAVAMVGAFLFALLWPAGGPRLLSLYFWPLTLVGLAYLLEGAVLAHYGYTWRSASGGRHVVVGLLAVLVGLVAVLNVNSAVAAVFGALPYAFGAERSREFVADRFAFLPLAVSGWRALALYRVVGALSLVGLLLATVAALWRLRTPEGNRRAYMRWLTGRGLRFALFPLLALPLVGLLYVADSAVSSPAQIVDVVVGNLRWTAAAQIMLLAVLLLLGDWYIVRALKGVRGGGTGAARDWTFVAGTLAIALSAAAAWYATSRGLAPEWEAWTSVGLLAGLYALGFLLLDRQQANAGPGADWSGAAGALLPLAAVCAGLALVPLGLGLGAEFARGWVWPWQVAAIVGLATLLMPSLALYFHARFRRLLVAPDSPLALLPALTGFAAVWLLFALGYVRDIALGAYVLSRQLAAVDDALVASLLAPTPLSPVVALWLLSLAALVLTVLVWQVAPLVRALATGVEESAAADEALPPAA